MMGKVGSLLSRILGGAWTRASAIDTVGADETLTPPERIIAPRQEAPLIDHVAFLLKSKDYVATHPVPEEFKTFINQYSHAGEPLIGDDPTRPAITDCSYEHFGRLRMSIGMPLFIEQAPLVKDNKINYCFNAMSLWSSFGQVLERYTGKWDRDSTKYGYYLPTNHYYMEEIVPPEIFSTARKVIDFYTRTDIRDPAEFIKKLDEKMKPGSPQNSPLPMSP